jgi:hypothetical protein
MRTTVAVALVVLASTFWTAAGQIFPSDAAPRGQLGMLRVGIFAGTCANPEQVAEINLNALAPMDQATDANTPLASYTEAPVALTELLAAPHAIVASVGGDVDAAVSCGALAGGRTGSLTVNLSEANDSGFTGVALLTAAGEVTQITVVLSEISQLPSLATPPAFPGTQEPSGGTPVGRQSPTVGTPTAARTPAIIPVRTPPAAQTPPALTPSPSPGKEEGAVYTSEQFGYAIAYGSPWQVSKGPEVDATSDYIQFSNGTSLIDFLGLAADMTAPVCMDRLYDSIRQLPGLHSIVSRPSTNTETLTTTPERAIEAWDVSFRDEAGQVTESTVYAQCLVLQPGKSVLVTTHEAPRDQYAAEATLREAFFAGVTLP